MKKANSIEQLIGKRIQKLRRSKGYTQQQFSEMIGISTNYLSDVERGKNSMRLGRLAVVIDALDCSADDVFMGAIKRGYKAKDSVITAAIERLSPDKQEIVFSVLDVSDKSTCGEKLIMSN